MRLWPVDTTPSIRAPICFHYTHSPCSYEQFTRPDNKNALMIRYLQGYLPFHGTKLVDIGFQEIHNEDREYTLAGLLI